jgi:hypothetical protein
MKTFLLIFSIFLLAGCSNKNAKDGQTPVLDTINSESLPNTTFVQDDNLDSGNALGLDSMQKLLYVVPIIQKELKVDVNYIISFMTASFKDGHDSKSSSAIIAVDGDDYSAEFYITLDKDKKMISYLRTKGGFCAGPADDNDSLMRLCSRRNSIVEDFQIKTFIINESIQFSKNKELSIIDSITNVSILGPNGQIRTTQMDSVRFYRARTRTK